MTLAPDRRLLVAASVVTAASVAVVALPGLLLPWLAATLMLLGATLRDAWLLVRLPRISVERLLPERAAMDVPATVRIVLRAGTPAPDVVSVIDECPPDLAATEPTFADVPLASSGEHAIAYGIVPTRRGDRVFGAVLTFERGPLGLLRRRTIHATPGVLPVFPRGAATVDRTALAVARRAATAGERPDRRRGSGLEFESLRDYVPGDDPRHVDCLASLRRGRLVTRVHQRERNQTLLVGVDASRLMGTRVGRRTKLDHAIDAALAVATAGLVQGDRVGAFTFDRTVRAFAPARPHRRNLAAVMDVLGRAQPAPVEASYWDVARTVRTRQPRRALVVLFTDFVEAADDVLLDPLHVVARHHRLLLVTVRDPVFERLLPGTPAGADTDVYERLAIDLLRRARDLTLERARRAGVQTLDLGPGGLTPPVLRRYLEVRATAL